MLKKFLFIIICLLIIFAFNQNSYFGSIITGVALFLLGMSGLEQGFKTFTGGRFADLLFTATRSKLRSFSFGCFITAVFQSSTLISLVTISFVSAGLISLLQGIGVVFGANVGSTLSMFLIATLGLKVKLSAYAMPLLVFGVLFQLQKNQHLKGSGTLILSMGFLLLGIDYIKEGFDSGATSSGMGNIWSETGNSATMVYFLTYMLAGVILTIIMQSSHALILLLIVALTKNQITFDAAVAACIGSNIGTTATAIVGAFNASSDGKRLAISLFVFKLLAALIIIPVLPLFLLLVDATADSLGIQHEATAARLALFHIFFNLTAVLALMPFLDHITRYLNTLFISREEKLTLNVALPMGKDDKAIFMNPAVLYSPDATIIALQREALQLYRNATSIVCFGIFLHREPLARTHDIETLIQQQIPAWPKWGLNKLYKRHIKGIVDDINLYAEQIRESELNEKQQSMLSSVQLACRNFSSAVKNTRRLRKYLKRAIRGKDEHTKAQYQKIRLRIAKAVHALEQLYARDTCLNDSAYLIKTVETLKQELHRDDMNFSKQMDRLIKDGIINSYTATALIHDNAYAMTICLGLVDGSAILLLGGAEKASKNEMTPDDDSHSHSLDYLYDLITENHIKQQRK